MLKIGYPYILAAEMRKGIDRTNSVGSPPITSHNPWS